MRNAPHDAPPVSDWALMIPQHEWDLYAHVMHAAQGSGLPFAIGGGFAFSAYSLRWRNTKDIDLYILHEHKDRFVELTQQAGFTDYFEEKPYDRAWIYRGYRDGVICDLIWAMANQRTRTDARWLTHGRAFDIRGIDVRMLPPEELIWAKLYVLQRDRCDWPDLLNILRVQAPQLDWEHLLERVRPDEAVLGGVMSLFKWVCPGVAAEVPRWVWERLGVAAPARAAGERCASRHVELLDTRDWFGPSADVQETPAE